jgi:hypothetical protein
MEPPVTSPRPPEPAEDATAASATVVDLTAGQAQITPVVVDGEDRYEIELPDAPLAEDDVESLAVALHAAQAGSAVLVDVEDYIEAVEPPEADPDYEV